VNSESRLRLTTLVGLILCCIPPGAPAAPASGWATAIAKRDLDGIERLLPTQKDVDERTEDGRTALMLAAGEANYVLVKALVARGAAINAHNERGGTPLMYAASGGDDQSVELLLSRGAEVNARARNGWTALTLAAARGFDGIVGNLLAHGADPNVTDIYGWTPLMRAVQAERLNVVKVLLAEHRVDMNVADEYGQTALHHAAAENLSEIARLLLARGARRDAHDRAGRTPRDLAEAAGHKELAALLGPAEK